MTELEQKLTERLEEWEKFRDSVTNHLNYIRKRGEKDLNVHHRAEIQSRLEFMNVFLVMMSKKELY